MFAVIFEVQPKEGEFDRYLGIAKHLKPVLETIDGFLDNERFMSTTVKGKLLSLSIWRDEAAVIRWREQTEHHRAQERGRSEVFADYHLRVGEVIADSGGVSGAQGSDETQVGAAKIVTVTEWMPGDGVKLQPDALAATLGLPADAISQETFESITNPGKLLLLAGWASTAACATWQPKQAFHHRSVRIVRDYGMRDRREAPQVWPAA